MAKRRQKRRSGEEVSKLLEEVRSRVSKGESLNAACKEMGIFPSLFYYHKNEQKNEKQAASNAQVEAKVNATYEQPSIVKSAGNAELELLRIKAKLYDMGIRLDQ